MFGLITLTIAIKEMGHWQLSSDAAESSCGAWMGCGSKINNGV